MPGALSLTNAGSASSQSMVSTNQSMRTLTGGGAHTTVNEASVTTAPPHTLVIEKNTGASDLSHTDPTSGATGPHGSPATTTPPHSPPRTTTDVGLDDDRPIPAKDKAPCDPPPPPPPPPDRPLKRIPTMKPGAPAVHGPGGEAVTDGPPRPPPTPVTSPTGASSASSSTAPNNSDPWLVLVSSVVSATGSPVN